MRKFGRCGVAATLVAVLLTMAAAPAHAAAGFTSSPSSGPAGTTITVTSTTACPAPPAGTTFGGVEIDLLNGPATETEAFSDATTDASRTWHGTLVVPAGLRNGEYHVGAACLLDDDSVYFGYFPDEFIVTSPAGQTDPAVRLAGTDRIETAIATSNDIYPAPDGLADAVVLARADSFADALAGTPLARDMGAPLLLTGRDSLDARTAAEIDRVLDPGLPVFVLGGTAAISDAVTASLVNGGHSVTRLAGVNRYDTAVKVAGAMDTQSTLLLATGTDFHDGLVAGAAAFSASADPVAPVAAVLLTNGGTMPPETKAYIDAHASLPRFAIGAPAAAADSGATPIVGSSDADTSRKVAERFFAGRGSVAIASAANFPDALSGGNHAAAFGAPLLFSDPEALPATVHDYLVSVKGVVSIAFVYGGTAAVFDRTRTAIAQAIT
ncbi:MAG: hypothetical protein QOD63_1441 [Actinomycetota bacterium]|jgi:putative cell wall-binding protein|nr:hypothetical protein [Actinomycetota bacterium]